MRRRKAAGLKPTVPQGPGSAQRCESVVCHGERRKDTIRGLSRLKATGPQGFSSPKLVIGQRFRVTR